MVFFNYALRKLNAKIVYYGPGLCGKTTNLQWIHDHFEGGQRGKMISLATEGDRTIFFDLLPIDIGSIRGMDVTLQLYTVPGQVHYNSTRQLVLRGADGVVFVADSQRTMKASNVESYENLQENLMLQGIEIKGFPHALQFNKRDLRDLLSTEDLDESLNVFSVPFFEAIATEGIGVQETLEGIVKLVMRNLREKYEPVANASGPHAPQPMQVKGPMAFKPPEKPAVVAPAPPAPVITPPAPVEPAPEAAPVASAEPGFAAIENEDEISTAVYDDENAETASRKPVFEGVDFGDKRSVFPPEVDTAADAFGPEETEGFGGFDAEPPGGYGADDDEVAAESADEIFEPDDMAGVADVVADSPQPPIPEESMEDLFETEVPSVKSFVENAMIGIGSPVERVGKSAADSAVPRKDPAPQAVAPPVADRYEDRIEAPGPFAPPAAPPPAPVSKPEIPEPMAPTAAIEVEEEAEEEAVRAEVRQALGASENREALAALSVNEAATPDVSRELLEDPPEVQPVVPPPPFEPTPVEDVTVSEETAPPVFVVDEPEAPEIVVEVDEEESVWDPEPIEVKFEAAAVEEKPVAEINVEAVPSEDPFVEEPAAAAVEHEPSTEAQVGPEPVAPAPPKVADSHEKSQPIYIGLGDPFADDDVATVIPEVLPGDAPAASASSAINVIAQDNQLHLQLKGSGAIAEIGEVRALDLEVPVPGQWVGNRKVTLQLRLTLTPSEDEDG